MGYEEHTSCVSAHHGENTYCDYLLMLSLLELHVHPVQKARAPCTLWDTLHCLWTGGPCSCVSPMQVSVYCAAREPAWMPLVWWVCLLVLLSSCHQDSQCGLERQKRRDGDREKHTHRDWDMRHGMVKNLDSMVSPPCFYSLPNASTFLVYSVLFLKLCFWISFKVVWSKHFNLAWSFCSVAAGPACLG